MERVKILVETDRNGKISSELERRILDNYEWLGKNIPSKIDEYSLDSIEFSKRAVEFKYENENGRNKSLLLSYQLIGKKPDVQYPPSELMWDGLMGWTPKNKYN